MTTRRSLRNQTTAAILLVAPQLSHISKRESCSLYLNCGVRGLGMAFDARLAQFVTLC